MDNDGKTKKGNPGSEEVKTDRSFLEYCILYGSTEDSKDSEEAKEKIRKKAIEGLTALAKLPGTDIPGVEDVSFDTLARIRTEAPSGSKLELIMSESVIVSRIRYRI